MVDKFSWIKKNKHYCHTCEKWLPPDHFRYIILNYGKNRQTVSYEDMKKGNFWKPLNPEACCIECSNKGKTIYEHDKATQERKREEKRKKWKLLMNNLKSL
jgi:hypothetical protein